MQFPVTYRRRFQVDSSSTSKSASEDMINRMPENVMSNIMDRLPIQEAVRTSILSRNWRFTWTLLSQLVFGYELYEYLERKKHLPFFYKKKNIGKVLLQLKGSITKFVLFTPNQGYEHQKEYDEMYANIVEDINHWILFLSTKGLQKFTLINSCRTPLKLPNHLFSCLELRHLELYNCCLHPLPGSHSFPKLLGFDFKEVEYESCKYGEFIALCPSLEHLKIDYDYDGSHVYDVKLGEIAKAVNLKVLSMMLYMLGDKVVVTSSDILQLVASLPKLEMLTLDFEGCYRVLAKAGSINRFSYNLHHLTKLALEKIDYTEHITVECACDLINGLPNLQTLKVTPGENDEDELPVPPDALKVVCSIKGNLQLRYVEFVFFGSTIEERFIESLLACSPLLKKMVIERGCYDHHHKNSCCSFTRKLLKFHRASPVAEIHLDNVF